MGPFGKAFAGAFAGRLFAALFLTVCAWLGLGPDKWVEWMIQDFPQWVTLSVARTAFLVLAAINLCFLVFPILRRNKKSLPPPLSSSEPINRNADNKNPEYKATLEEAREVLDELEGEFSQQEHAKAYEGLENGDPTNAETLFRRILAVSGSTVSVLRSSEKAFKAALMLSRLAEGHGDGEAALRYNKQAMELKPSGLTGLGYGLVGDDIPKVIVALSTIQFSKRTISGIHEATGVNESTIEQNLEWLKNNGLAVKSETDSPYWRLTLKGREVFTS